MTSATRDDRGLFEALIGDGRPLLLFFGLSIILSGGFAVFLAGTGRFLPHDTAFLGMTAEDLCALHGCRIVHFMVHDRVSFGGALIAIGVFYVWLAEFPLRKGEAWAWWLFLVSGLAGFCSFLAYLGYGYLDTWHGLGTLLLVPLFVGGLAMTRRNLHERRGIGSLFSPSVKINWKSSQGLGRLLLLATACGMIGAGLTILVVGMTRVFVPQDLTFMGVAVDDLRAINARLVPLIAHDRSGFGGGICACGITVLFSVWCGRSSKSLWQALCVAGLAGFGAAISVHPAVGYTDLTHLGPAMAGGLIFAAGLILSFKPMMSSSGRFFGTNKVVRRGRRGTE